MKSLFTFLLIITVFGVSAQEGVIVKYFDYAWKPTSKEYASYYTQFVKEDTLYKCITYYSKSNKIYAKSTYSDTLFSKGKARGVMVLYYENGFLKDSSFFNNLGILQFSYYYYQNGNISVRKINPSDSNKIDITNYNENGSLWMHQYFDTTAKKMIKVGYDESGKINPKFIFQKEAEFPGGRKGWKEYLQKNLRSDLPTINGAPKGIYTVTLDFVVDKDGTVSNITNDINLGFGISEEAIRVLTDGPRWTPAIQNGHTVKYRARQQISFVVD